MAYRSEVLVDGEAAHRLSDDADAHAWVAFVFVIRAAKGLAAGV